MQIEGEYQIAAPPPEVWRALNDPTTLRDCIPGCESLQVQSADTYLCEITASYGPVKARFNTQLRIEDSNPPHEYTLIGEGKGGAAGFGKGRAEVSLQPSETGTLLRYSASFSVGGKLGQLGSRLTAATTRKLSQQFFNAFCARFDAPGGED